MSSKKGKIVKRFARCTNCQQWYVQTFTASVEIYQHDRLCCLTVWCLQCINEAEKRSQPHGTALATEEATPVWHMVDREERPSPLASSDTLQHYMQEHLQLMDRALYDDETSLVPAIQDFIERCRLSQTTVEMPEQCQRLTGYLQYWETFLKALNASSPRPATSTPDESSAGSGRD
jgi:hypothetical protein